MVCVWVLAAMTAVRDSLPSTVHGVQVKHACLPVHSPSDAPVLESCHLGDHPEIPSSRPA